MSAEQESILDQPYIRFIEEGNHPHLPNNLYLTLNQLSSSPTIALGRSNSSSQDRGAHYNHQLLHGTPLGRCDEPLIIFGRFDVSVVHALIRFNDGKVEISPVSRNQGVCLSTEEGGEEPIEYGAWAEIRPHTFLHLHAANTYEYTEYSNQESCWRVEFGELWGDFKAGELAGRKQREREQERDWKAIEKNAADGGGGMGELYNSLFE